MFVEVPPHAPPIMASFWPIIGEKGGSEHSLNLGFLLCVFWAMAVCSCWLAGVRSLPF